MCGIAGILQTNTTNTAATIKKMVAVLAHRGPDGDGCWMNETKTVALGHRRLAIIDTSNAAQQPLYYNNRYTIIHNGELYNYIELRQQLQSKGYQFTSAGDTEVIVAAYDYWKQDCLQQFDGMFAFAIWDAQLQELFAARDRFGEKPFYYYKSNDHFLFASEMKALWEAGVPKKINGAAWLNYLALGQTQTNDGETFYENIAELPAANYLQYKNNQLNIVAYWQLLENTEKISSSDAIEKFKALFTDAVKKRLRSDVPVGISLSGGLDSSSIVTVIKQLGQQPATFSAVFPGFEKDESSYIKEMTNYAGVVNYPVTPTAAGFIADFEKLCYHQEAPFQSASIYTQYKVYELAAKKNIKVLLDGQGADETLAGYNQHFNWYWQQLLAGFKWQLYNKERKAAAQKQIHTGWTYKNIAAAFLPVAAAAQVEQHNTNSIKNHQWLTPDFINAHYDNFFSVQRPAISTLNHALHYHTTQIGLPALLRYADRNSMAHGCEVRLPFLSHQLVSFVFSLPASLKIKEGFSKYILRAAMQTQLPASICWRTNKIGFEPPQQLWMQEKQTQEYIHAAKEKLVNARILNAQVLQQKIQPHAAHAAENNDWRFLVAATLL